MSSPSEVNGNTRLYAIIAHPIHHVQTPQAINALFHQRGYNGLMVPFHVHPEALASTVQGLRGLSNLEGFIVTVPHKTAMLALCDHLTPRAAAVGAVNAVRRLPSGELLGDMLDGLGFVSGLRQAGIEPAGLAVYMAGAGGAANAIAFALAEAGIARLTIANRTVSNADALRQRLQQHYPALSIAVGSRDPSGHALVVNATSLGLHEGDPLPCDTERLQAEQTVAEIIMQPVHTPLLRAAAARGCRIQPGLPMLQGQVALMARAMGAPQEGTA